MRETHDSGGTRRRGAALEAAILDAAWAELSAQGYRGLTLQAVATRAGTSRPVLARRWPSVMALTTAALARRFTLHPITIPDLGDLRAELKMLLRALADRAPPELLRYVIEMGDDLRAARSSLTLLRAEIADPDVVHSVLRRGVARGEIDAARLTPRIGILVVDLAVHEELMTLEAISDRAIDEIVDDIFLPLVAPRPG